MPEDRPSPDRPTAARLDGGPVDTTRAGLPTRPPVVLITGASSGIGRATAHAFAAEGAALVLAGRSLAALVDVHAECSGQAETMVLSTDVSDNAAVETLFEAAVERFGRVDVVVHSAAVVAYGDLMAIPSDVFDQVVHVNVLGTAHVARAALTLFTAQGGGRLVLVGSLLGKIAAPFMSPYITSKWAVHGLARTLQAEVRRTPGVDVILISPGSVDTPVYARAGNYLGRVGRPPPPVVSAARVARAIVKATRKPRREVSVGVLNPLVVTGFRFLPGVFDVLVTPLMKVAGISRRRTPPHPGNVFAPDDQHGVTG